MNIRRQRRAPWLRVFLAAIVAAQGVQPLHAIPNEPRREERAVAVRRDAESLGREQSFAQEIADGFEPICKSDECRQAVASLRHVLHRHSARSKHVQVPTLAQLQQSSKVLKTALLRVRAAVSSDYPELAESMNSGDMSGLARSIGNGILEPAAAASAADGQSGCGQYHDSRSECRAYCTKEMNRLMTACRLWFFSPVQPLGRWIGRRCMIGAQDLLSLCTKDCGCCTKP
jgi:hypothetical protein